MKIYVLYDARRIFTEDKKNQKYFEKNYII